MATYTKEERHRLTGEYARKQNEPYKEAVTINCAGIGDDNDYSCYLGRVVYLLWKAGHKEEARVMWNTDPMLMEYCDEKRFEIIMNDQQKREQQEG